MVKLWWIDEWERLPVRWDDAVLSGMGGGGGGVVFCCPNGENGVQETYAWVRSIVFVRSAMG